MSRPKINSTTFPGAHLHLVEPASSMARAPTQAPDPQLPPPLSAAARCELAKRMGAVLFLEAVEAGASKAAELDGELLDCCAAAHGADRVSGIFMDRMSDMTLDDPVVLDSLARMRPAVHTYFDAVDRAAELPARTPEGLRAKAALLLLHIRSGEDHTMLAGSLARDVAGRA